MFTILNDFLNLTELDQGQGYPVYTGEDSALVIKIRAVFFVIVFLVVLPLIHFFSRETLLAFAVAAFVTKGLRLKLRHPKNPPVEKE